MKIIYWILIFFISTINSLTNAQDSFTADQNNQDPPYRISAGLAKMDRIYLGQKVTLWVDVKTNTWFTAAPQFGDVHIAHALILQLSKFNINFTEQIAGETWAVQRKEYIVYPQRAGTYSVPALDVEISYAIPGKSPGKAILKSPSLAFTTQMPPGAEKVGYFVNTPGLTVKDIFNKELQDLRVGDSLKRTITMVAEDSVGMLLPALRFDRIDGIAVYQEPPQVSDQVSRWESTGMRVESVTYLFEKEGEYLLPDITLFWWDPQESELKKEILSALKLNVAPNPELAAESIVTETKPDTVEAKEKEYEANLKILHISLLVAGILLMVLLIRLFIPRVARRVMQRLKKKKQLRWHSEQAYFRRFRQACRSNENLEIFKRLMSWLDCIYDDSSAVTLDRLVADGHDPALQSQVNGLKTELFGKNPDDQTGSQWSPRLLSKHVIMARRGLLKKIKTTKTAVIKGELNP